jgi:uncharacterized phage protein (TIGR02218 family)
MRALDPALADALAGGATTLCACWLIVRADGVRLGFTDHDEDVRFDGVVFAAAGAVTGSAVESTLGLAADQSEIAGALSAGALTEADIEAGRYDGAEVSRWLVDWREPARRALLFRGMIGAVERQGVRFSAEVLGLSALLNRPLGRAFLPTCDAALGDERCRVDLAAGGFRAEATVTSVAGTMLVVAGLDAFAAGWFARGRAVFLDGAAAGVAAAVASDRLSTEGRVLDLWGPPRAGLAPGTRLSVEAGCDKRLATCRDRFRNLANFRGFPHMPGDGWIMSYPAAGERADGGSRRG